LNEQRVSVHITPRKKMPLDRKLEQSKIPNYLIEGSNISQIGSLSVSVLHKMIKNKIP
jgi:hypothetical protein